MSTVKLYQGDCLTVMRGMPENSVDAVVTDPPAGIAFMNKSWDKDKGGRSAWIAWMTEIAAECLRLLKPGGHALVWALPRTSHWTATAWEDAGFEIRDCIYHIGGQGFPKGHDVSKAIDKHLGKERTETEWYDKYHDGLTRTEQERGIANIAASAQRSANTNTRTMPATPEAAQWQGWNSALKPAVECWWLLRKPLSEKNIADNVLAWGTGGINVDACRIGTEAGLQRPQRNGKGVTGGWANYAQEPGIYGTPDGQGRWPANLILDEEAAALLDEQSGERKTGGIRKPTGRDDRGVPGFVMRRVDTDVRGHDDTTGGASRFFLRVAPDAEADEPLRFLYCAKASRSDRNSDGAVNNTHSTVKPQMLMRWLAKLICPPNGVVLDPFLGSGSTGVAAVLEGFSFVGIDKEAEYLTIAAARIEHAASQVEPQLPLFEAI